MKNRNNSVVKIATVALLLGMASQPAFAGTATGLPWEGALDILISAMTGKIALALSILAIAVTGGMLAFGGELNDFAKKACFVVLAIALIVAAPAFINTFFGFSGANIL